MAKKPLIYLFRRDLRLGDNAGFAAACERGGPVLPVFILHDGDGVRPMGGAGRWWLHHSLASLGAALEQRGARLLLRRGDTAGEILRLCAETGADAVYLGRMHGAPGVERGLLDALHGAGIETQCFPGGLLTDPDHVRTGTGGPFKVFTPFWRACRASLEPGPVVPAPASVNGYQQSLPVDELHDWRLLPSAPDWSGGLAECWTPGEHGARDVLDRFADEALGDYRAGREIPGRSGTSRLSPYLHFGELSPRQVWERVRIEIAADGKIQQDADVFLSEIGWREFSAHLLHHWPELPEQNLRGQFDAFPWRRDPAQLAAWQQGRTGIPLVDAGMRELWHTGWMHNRVRMVTASFLVKNLMLHWKEGEAWFWDTLVDADPASNAANWQWVAGSGADAAPYFRIFNPVLQSEKFDPQGAYLRRWIPEIAALPDRYIHRPWTAPRAVLEQAGVEPGKDYPEPLVDLKISRERALAAFRSLPR